LIIQRIEGSENTRKMPYDTGGNYEKLIESMLREHSEYDFETQKRLGRKPSGTKHVADIFLTDTQEVISLKTQSVGGTSEEKIPYEVYILQHAVNEGRCKSATIVLHGDGWREKKWYLSKDFCMGMGCPDVCIMEHDDFVEQYICHTNIRKERGLEKFF